MTLSYSRRDHKATLNWYIFSDNLSEPKTCLLMLAFRTMITPVFAALLALLVGLSERVRASPSLTDKYDNQQTELERVKSICFKQYQQAKFHPAIDPNSQFPNESTYRWIVTAKGVQAISSDVVEQNGGRYKCERGEYELPRALGKDYVSSMAGLCVYRNPYSNDRRITCGPPISKKERFEIEQCGVVILKSCLSVYKQWNNKHVTRTVLGVEYIKIAER